METTTNKFDYRYSFAGRAAWERKTKQNADKYIAALSDNWGYAAMQDLHWMLTYHQNKGAVAIEEIEFAEADISQASQEMFNAILDWMKARAETTNATKSE